MNDKTSKKNNKSISLTKQGQENLNDQILTERERLAKLAKKSTFTIINGVVVPNGTEYDRR